MVKRLALTLLLVGMALLLLNAAGTEQVVARVNGKPITMAELQKQLVEGYGLKVLLFQVQLNLAKQEAETRKVTVTPADIAAELDRTLKAAFKDIAREDYPALLGQLLERQNLSRAEFDTVIETNATLRKIAEPQLVGRITDDNVKEAFNTKYGQTAVLRHIQCSNAQEALQAKMRVASGEKFEAVAELMSRNARTAPLQGELPPFSKQSVTWPGGLGKIPQSFKDWAFNSKVGDLSDPIQGDNAYHILKLEKRLEPRIVKFDDVKDAIRAELFEKLLEEAVKVLRGQLALNAQKLLSIEEPTLKQQFEKRLADQKKAIEDEQRIRQELHNKARLPGDQAPATQPINPTTLPSGTPAGSAAPVSPGNAPTGERPPATKSANPPADVKK